MNIPKIDDPIITKVVGMEFNSARDYLLQFGIMLRTVKRDGVDLLVSEDMRLARLNVETENGKIVRVYNFS